MLINCPPRTTFGRSLMMLFIGSIVFAAGCGTYVWKHPTKDQAAFHADRLACEEKALTLYPVTIVQTQAQAGYDKPPSTRCETRDGATSCESTAATYVPPKVETRDVNENNRARAIDSCLGAAGWARVREK